MRFKFLVVCLLGLVLCGSALGAIVVDKRARLMPHVEVFGCQGVNAFIFRGPKGEDRRPILVPPREYWTAREAGRYKFWLRDGSGRVCSRLVTPEVYARYQVGEDFNVCAPMTERTTQDSKTMATVSMHTRKHTAKVKKHTTNAKKHTAKVKKRTYKKQLAKHSRKHRPKRLAAR